MAAQKKRPQGRGLRSHLDRGRFGSNALFGHYQCRPPRPADPELINAVLQRITVHRRKLQMETTKPCATSPCALPTKFTTTLVFTPRAAIFPYLPSYANFFESLSRIAFPRLRARRTIRRTGYPSPPFFPVKLSSCETVPVVGSVYGRVVQTLRLISIRLPQRE
jgi:hypothetical protein